MRSRLAVLFAVVLILPAMLSALTILKVEEGYADVTIRALYDSGSNTTTCYNEYSIDRQNLPLYLGVAQTASLTQIKNAAALVNGTENLSFDSAVHCCSLCDATGLCDSSCTELKKPSGHSGAAPNSCTVHCPMLRAVNTVNVPGSYNLTFQQPLDTCGVAVPLQQSCSGRRAQVQCINGTCTFNCQFAYLSDCPFGACSISLSYCGPSSCPDYDNVTGEWSNCTASACDGNTSAGWRECSSQEFNLNQVPAGCTYNNPACASDEFCSDNSCVKKQCTVASSCGASHGCNSFSCSDYKCLNATIPGCEYSDMCYKYGYQPIIGNETFYCSYSNSLQKLKATNSTCADSFECASGLCFNQVCTEKPTANTITDFFGGIANAISSFVHWVQGLFGPAPSPTPTPLPGNQSK